MEEIVNIHPVLADLVMEAGYRAIDVLLSQVRSMHTHEHTLKFHPAL